MGILSLVRDIKRWGRSSDLQMAARTKTLTFSTPTVRNDRTLVWLRTQSPVVAWWKWDGVVTSLEDYHRWTGCGGRVVGVVLADGCGCDSSGQDAWLEDVWRVAKKVTFVLLCRSVIQWKPAAYWEENFDNVMVLEDLHESYPFVGGAWRGTACDGVLMLALIGRYHRLVDTVDGVADHERPLYDLRLENGTRPADLVLYTQYYTSKDKERAKELRECLRRNVKNRAVDRVVLLTERDESVAWASFAARDKEKIVQRVIGRRLTYGDFFRDVAAAAGDAIVMLANADIYVGEEIEEVWRIRWEDRAVALLRWDDVGKGPKGARVFGPRADSQDAWLFSAKSVAERRWTGDADIPLGKPGCDNAILRVLLTQRFLLSNPALSLKTYHLHSSGVRTYRKEDTVSSPVYIHLEPTYLIDTQQVAVPPAAPSHLCNEVASFRVKASSLSNEITYCTMLERGGRWRWEPMVDNYAFEPAIPVYTWSGGAAVTPNGLVYDLYRIYTGRAALSDPAWNLWPTAGVDLFTPMRHVSRMLALPCPVEVFGSWGRYMVEYLSRVLRLRAELSCGKASFWLPTAFRGRLEAFAPDLLEHAVLWEPGVACWADEVIGRLPGPCGAEVGREEIRALRQAQRKAGWSPVVVGGKVCVLWQGGALTASVVENLKGWIEAAGWTVVVTGCDGGGVEGVQGSAVMIWDRCPEAVWEVWRLPEGARAIEGMSELEVVGEAQHLAHMSGVEGYVVMMPKGLTEDDLAAEWHKELAATGIFSL